MAAALFVGSLALVPAIGFSLFPKAGTPQFRVTHRDARGSSLAETDRAARFVERVLARRPEVKSVMMNVGHGNPHVYYNVIPRNERSSVAEVFVLLHQFDPGRTPQLFDSLRRQFDGYPGARIEVTRSRTARRSMRRSRSAWWVRISTPCELSPRGCPRS